MKSIHRRLKRFKKLNQGLGDYINLYNAVINQEFTRRSIAEAFLTLVPKEDYEQTDKRILIKNLYEASKRT